MDYFLERIAKSLKNEFKDLNRHCLVFPGRRAGLYIIKYLSEGLERPMWAPATFTINELFRSGSSLQLAGTEVLLCELFKVYSSIRKKPESFDDFYFWGDMMLNDFDDIDKYLVDPSSLFRNVSDLKDIDVRFGGLTDEQKKIIKSFWINFEASKPTNEKDTFVSTWSVLNEIYTEFRSTLKDKKLAYEGMIFRDIAEGGEECLSFMDAWDLVHFIGFNALNACEKKIMMSLKKAGKARFYWDYDNSYINENDYNSAGYFIRENLGLFGNNMPEDWNYDTSLSFSEKKVTRKVIETSSDVAQAKLIPELIKNIHDLTPENAHHTAVVLSDENLLMPVLTSLPEGLDINITMGYPLRQTLVYTFTRLLMELQRSNVIIDGEARFPVSIVRGLLKHPLVKRALNEDERIKSSEIVSGNIAWIPSCRFCGMLLTGKMFTKIDDTAKMSEWFRDMLTSIASAKNSDKGSDDLMEESIINEFTYRIVLALNRLEAVLKTPGIILSAETYLKILDRLLRNQSVPFSGEPLSGIQVMGILETRALDFRNLIIMSVNEGVMPSLSSSSSFIPFSLRDAFGLPSINHQESIFAYHFYRLQHRAENVIFTFNSSSEGLKSGEMSRFLIQMNYDEYLRPEFLNQGFVFMAPRSASEILQRTDDHAELLYKRYLGNGGNILSPSAINTWLSCRMKFYFRYVTGLREPDKISAKIDPAMFGTILHEAMTSIYKDYPGEVVITSMLETLVKDEKYLQNTIDKAILEKFKKGYEGPVTGNELIIKDVLQNFLRRILRADISASPFTLLFLEDFFEFGLDLKHSEDQISVRIGGYVDRIDLVKEGVRIVDYKTGYVSESISSVEDLFEEDRKKDSDGWLQVLLYCEAFSRKFPGKVVMPSIYKIRKMSSKSFSDKLIIKQGREGEPVLNYLELREQFISGLVNTVSRIFNPDEPFIMTRNIRDKCRYCPYCRLCSR